MKHMFQARRDGGMALTLCGEVVPRDETRSMGVPSSAEEADAIVRDAGVENTNPPIVDHVPPGGWCPRCLAAQQGE